MKKYLDKSISKEERIKEYKKEMNSVLNPIPEKDFNPKTFDPISVEGMEDLEVRQRKTPIGRLPTFGIEPKEIMEGQMIGMYESKQDLYLLFAHKYNELLDEIEKLKKLIK